MGELVGLAQSAILEDTFVKSSDGIQTYDRNAADFQCPRNCMTESDRPARAAAVATLF